MSKHLRFYEKCFETGSLPEEIISGGLCNCAKARMISEQMLKLFHPTPEDKKELGKKGLDYVYWASENKWDNFNSHSFNPLRQTIVAFMIAMEELGYLKIK